MTKTLSKTIHDYCFSKLKRSISTVNPPPIPLSTKDDNPSSTIKLTSSLFSNLTKDFSSSSSDEFSDTENTPPDFATVFASQRFFFTSPGRSNSIIDSGRFSGEESEYPSPESDKIITGGIPIMTYSPDPYLDFRQSMQEMVEAKEVINVKQDGNYLHELLLCYLNLNPKDTHKFIMEAFFDLLVSLMKVSNI